MVPTNIDYTFSRVPFGNYLTPAAAPDSHATIFVRGPRDPKCDQVITAFAPQDIQTEEDGRLSQMPFGSYHYSDSQLAYG